MTTPGKGLTMLSDGPDCRIGSDYGRINPDQSGGEMERKPGSDRITPFRVIRNPVRSDARITRRLHLMADRQTIHPPVEWVPLPDRRIAGGAERYVSITDLIFEFTKSRPTHG